jgi:exonuclease III
MECHNVFLVAKSHVGVQAVAKRKKEKKETGHFLLMGKDQILKSSIYKDKKFSDHAPLMVDYNFS